MLLITFFFLNSNHPKVVGLQVVLKKKCWGEQVNKTRKISTPNELSCSFSKICAWMSSHLSNRLQLTSIRHSVHPSGWLAKHRISGCLLNTPKKVWHIPILPQMCALFWGVCVIWQLGQSKCDIFYFRYFRYFSTEYKPILISRCSGWYVLSLQFCSIRKAALSDNNNKNSRQQ